MRRSSLFSAFFFSTTVPLNPTRCTVEFVSTIDRQLAKNDKLARARTNQVFEKFDKLQEAGIGNGDIDAGMDKLIKLGIVTEKIPLGTLTCSYTLYRSLANIV